MSSNPRILAFGGSLRAASFNQRVAQIAAEGARRAGAEVTVIALRDFPMPVFDQDLEEAGGMPEKARELKKLFLSHDGLLIASPEYNSSITAALKNALDWVSRAESDSEPPVAAFRGKVAAILGASPGALGGLRGLVHLRSILSNVGVLVLAEQIAVSKAGDAFQEDGKLKDAKQQSSVERIGEALANTLRKLKA